MKILELSILALFGFITKCCGQEGVCSSENCKLPDCFCAGRQGPLQLQTKDIPQMAVFTFDDALNEENYPFYTRLFRSGRNNPNGCPIAATFFVSHDWTNYDYVRELYIDGHEIASHSITHKMPQSWWSRASYSELKEELEGQRKNIVHHAKIPKSQIRGIRVPFLETGGDTQFALMKNEGFEYDSSFIAGPYFEGDWRLPVWPYTLEYPPGLEFCDNHNCPKGNFSGIWEFPLNRWIGLDGKACPMVDACTTHTIDTKQQALDYLWKNFDRYHGNNKAPFGVNMHATWFNDEYKLDAMDEFISKLTQMDDVYIVSLHQLIQWMKNPTQLRDIKEFSPWKTTCGKRRRLVTTRTQPPKPRLRVVQEDNGYNEIGSEGNEKFRKTTLRTRMRNVVSNGPAPSKNNRGSSNRYTNDHDKDILEDNRIKHQRIKVKDENDEHVDYRAIHAGDKEKIKVNAVHKPDPRDSRKPAEEHDDVIPRQRKPIVVSKQGKPANLSGKDKQAVNSKQNVSSATLRKVLAPLTFLSFGLSILTHFP